MSIRVTTLHRLAGTRRNVFRVRRRYTEIGTWVADVDGDPRRPDTWERWEEEYFSQYAYMVHMVALDPAMPAEHRREGFMDQVPAREVWGELTEEEREPWLAGRHAVLEPMVRVRKGGERKGPQ